MGDTRKHARAMEHEGMGERGRVGARRVRAVQVKQSDLDADHAEQHDQHQ